MAKVEPYIYNARLIRVVDGDTADAWIDCGFNISVKKRIRFMGVDTWESRTRDLEEKAKGLEAKAFTKHLFVKGHEKSVNELLKEHGHAYEYHGEKKKIFGS